MLNNFLNAINQKAARLKNAPQKKTLRIEDIVLIPEFEKLMEMDDSVIKPMIESFRTEGFKHGHELHIWRRGYENILIDGHTRRYCALQAGLSKVPCIIHHFDNVEAAKAFALKEQIVRRNWSGKSLLAAVAQFNFEKGKGNSGDEKGKASEIIGKKLGVSSKTVEKARVVLKEASEEQKQAIKNNDLSINQVYQQLRGKEPNDAPDKKVDHISSKEKAFIQGIQYAITQFYSCVGLKDLYLQTIDSFDYQKMSSTLKEFDFTKIIDSTAPYSTAGRS